MFSGLRGSLVVAGTSAFAVAAVLLVLFPSSSAGIDFHQIHTDSLIYLCHGLQIGPLSPSAANDLASAVSLSSDQRVYPCFDNSGAPVLLLQTYYPRIVLAVLVAGASILASHVVVLSVPILIMGFLGGVWGFIVGLPERRPTWLRWVVLLLPLLSFAWVLWLGSLMTEGVFTLTLLGATLTIWLHSSRKMSDRSFVFWMLMLGLILLAIRTSWPIAGLLWGFGLAAFIAHTRTQGRPTRGLTITRWALVSLAVTVGLVAAWGASRLLEYLLVPDAVFPPSNEPLGVLPSSPTDLLFVLRVSIDSVLVGFDQSRQLPDFGSIVLVALMPVIVVMVLARSPLPMTVFVIANWLLSLVIVGVVSLCCGGLNSYFRYLIPAMFVSLAAAWLGSTRPSRPGFAASPPATDADANTRMQDA